MERRTVADRAADREVARALRARGGAGTVADVEVGTALPAGTVNRSLDRLLDRYEGTVGVAQGGALIYRFAVGALGLKARRERRVLFGAAVRAGAAVASAAVAAFRAVWRAVLAIQLLVYLMVILAPISVVVGAVVGVGVFLIMIVAALGDGDASGLFDLLANPYVFAVVLAGCIVYGIYRVFRKKMDLIMALAGKDERGKPGVAGFVAQINDFALGPERPPTRAERIDRAWTIRQEDEQLVLERTRAQGGRLRAGDLVAWLGLGLEEADRQATRICVEHEGEPAAADIDVVEFELRSLLATVDAAVAASGQTRHERGVLWPRLTANNGKEDLTIALLALANGAAGIVGWALLGGRGDGWWRVAWIAGGVLPVAFTGLLLGLLVLRVPGFLVRRARTRRAKRRAEIHDAIVAHCRAQKETPLDLATLGTREETRPVALALAGSFDLDSDDPTKTVWRWPRLARELVRVKSAEKVKEVKELAD